MRRDICKNLCLVVFLASAFFLLGGCGNDISWESLAEEWDTYFSEESLIAPSQADATETPDNKEVANPVSAATEADSFLVADASGAYAYSYLSDAEKLWYKDIETILGTHAEEAELSADGIALGLDETCIDTIFQSVLLDHPELFFVEGYSYTKYTTDNQLTKITFRGTYTVDLETAENRKNEIDAQVARILAGISSEANDYTKVKYVYDTLISETDYDLNAADNQNIYSIFVNHKTVCQGYAKATQYLLNCLGVETQLCLGRVESGEAHAWNLVKIDGNYYYVDTTWGDASYQTLNETGTSSAKPEISYDYLNVTSKDLFRTHSLDGIVPMPECVSLEANYYVVMGLYFQAYDREQMKKAFRDAQERGDSYVTVKCADETAYGDVVNAMIENQEIFEYVAGGQTTVAYTQNTKQLSLSFWMTN